MPKPQFFQEIRRYWGVFVGALVVVMLLSTVSVVAILVEMERRARIQESDQERVELCERQHAIIEMQRLFLMEHAAIRLQLEDAGIPDRHAHPGLLKDLERLIEEGDCIVNQDVKVGD